MYILNICFCYSDPICIHISLWFICVAEICNYSLLSLRSLPVHLGPLTIIDYSKQIRLAQPLSFECFHSS